MFTIEPPTVAVTSVSLSQAEVLMTVGDAALTLTATCTATISTLNGGYLE